MRVLILGAYGLIGAVLARRLAGAGCTVIGLGRSRAMAARIPAVSRWIFADLRSLTTSESWRAHVAEVDVVINAAGALQDGAKDDLAAVQDAAMRALYDACVAAGGRRVIQISAPGVSATSTTAFFRTKAAADAALVASGLDWVIFRPGLVLTENAYGGTQLLRTLAAFPFVQPLMLGDRRLQTVAMDDVADAVARAVQGEVPQGVYDLVERDAPTIAEIVRKLRAWLGFAPAVATLETPRWLGAFAALIADGAGWLGWRSPLRSTAMRVLDGNVIGDPAPWRALIGHDLKSLDQTLASLPATAQERLYARAQLLLPAMLMTLAAFWIASGVIALVSPAAAAAVLTPALGPSCAHASVIAFSFVDIALGAGLLIRRLARLTALGMVLVTALYLIAGAVLAPDLWRDPLGPMLKAIPAALLALVAAALLEER